MLRIGGVCLLTLRAVAIVGGEGAPPRTGLDRKQCTSIGREYFRTSTQIEGGGRRKFQNYSRAECVGIRNKKREKCLI